MPPQSLYVLSIASLCMAALSFLVIAVDLVRHPQTMAVMNPVWPITALYLGPSPSGLNGRWDVQAVVIKRSRSGKPPS